MNRLPTRIFEVNERETKNFLGVALVALLAKYSILLLGDKADLLLI